MRKAILGLGGALALLLLAGCTTLCGQPDALPASAMTPCTLRYTKTTAMMPTVKDHLTLGWSFIPIPYLTLKTVRTTEMVPIQGDQSFAATGAAATTCATTCQTQCATTAAPTMFYSTGAPAAVFSPPAPPSMTFVNPAPPAPPVAEPGPRAPLPQGPPPLKPSQPAP
jgi:hypothetical protein